MQEIYRIERVLKRENDRVFVKWKDYNSAFGSWIPLADVEQLCMSTHSMPGSPAATTVVKTVLSFLEMCVGLLLERVDVGRQRSLTAIDTFRGARSGKIKTTFTMFVRIFQTRLHSTTCKGTYCCWTIAS